LIRAEEERTGYNIAEKVIKIGLAGLSGKVAQSIGGSNKNPPGCFNVHYASAIRAGTRRAIGEAALQKPHETVQFCTDAAFSKVRLNLDEGEGLGQWEIKKVRGLATFQSGIYSYKDDGGEEAQRLVEAYERGEAGISEEAYRAAQRGKITNMSRGFSAGSVDVDEIERRLEEEGVPLKERRMVALREVLLTKGPNAWRQPAIKDGKINPASQSIELTLRTFMTAGSAVASRRQFELMGRWANVPRRVNVHTPGPKRRLLDADDFEGPDAAERAARLYSTVNGEDGRRCHELVPTAPARPEGDTWNVMSRPHVPKWYEGEAELENDWEMESDRESEDILMGDQ
jgi:hypothetical protein